MWYRDSPAGCIRFVPQWPAIFWILPSLQCRMNWLVTVTIYWNFQGHVIDVLFKLHVNHSQARIEFLLTNGGLVTTSVLFMAICSILEAADDAPFEMAERGDQEVKM